MGTFNKIRMRYNVVQANIKEEMVGIKSTYMRKMRAKALLR